MTPFVFPQEKHRRRLNPGPFATYQQYKPYLRQEFFGKCVYCRMPDSLQRQDAFGVDHYRPKSVFPALVCNYPNLFYACNACNRRKGPYWHANAAQRFIPNPCDHAMGNHLRFRETLVESRTPPGAFACELLDLNSDEVLGLRSLVATLIKTLELQLRDVENTLNKLRRKGRKQPDDREIRIGIEELEAKRAELAACLKQVSGEDQVSGEAP